MPNRDGSTKMHVSKIAKPRAEEMTADSNALPMDVK
jgi:hypothetical protein